MLSKTGLTLEGLQPLGSALLDFDTAPLERIPAEAFDIDDRAQFFLADQPVSLTDEAEISFLNEAEVPVKFAKRQPPQLRANILRHWLEHSEALRKGTFFVNERREAVNFVRAGSDWIRPVDILTSLNDQFSDKLMVHRIEQNNPRLFSISLVSPEHHLNMGEETQGEDHLYGGVILDHSPNGDKATKIQGRIFRLVCSNGAITEAKDRITRHTAGSPATWQPRLVGAVNQILGTMSVQFDRLRHTAHVPSPTAEQLISSLKLLMNISPTLVEMIQLRFAIDCPRSLYDAINIVTACAHELESPALIRQAETLGGVIVNHAVACGSCGRLV